MIFEHELCQDKERFEGYTVFHIKYGNSIIKMMCLTDVKVIVKNRVSLDELKKVINTYIEVAQRNVNKPFNKNNRDEREHYLYWHATLSTLKYLKDEFFPSPERAPIVSGSTKEGRAEVQKVQERKACPDAVGSAGVQPRKTSALPYCSINNSQHSCCLEVKKKRKVK